MELLIYIVKANVAFALFALAYYLLLRKDTRLNARRAYLLLATITALLVHVIPSPLPPLVVVAEPFIETVQATNSNSLASNHTHSWLWATLVTIGAMGMLVMLLRLIIALCTVVRYKSTGVDKSAFGINYIEIEEKTIPFTLFSWIFISKSTAVTKEIILHERAHARMLHWVDTLFIEGVHILFWYNPAVWYMRSAVRENSEYLADRCVLKQGIERKQYQYSLVNLHFEKSENIVATYFNNSQIKNRIIMMNKSENRPLTILKYSVLPLLILLLSVTTARSSEYVDSTYQTEEAQPMSDKPLYIVDGVEVTPQIANSIDTEKIESIDVLKGDAAIAKYGKKAQNGAVSITLKKEATK